MNVKSFTFNPFAENTYIIYDETKEAIVIDPGCFDINERRQLKKFIDDNGLIIKRLINTHCHLDHIFGNPFIAETYQVGLECHRNEAKILAGAPIAGEMFGVPVPPQPDISHFIEEGDAITFGNSSLKAILAPGHSPGSLCFHAASDGFLIGGDVLFFRSIGRTDLPGGSHNQLIESIKSKIYTLPDATKVYSGHGIPTTIGFEKQNNPFVSA